MKQGFDTKLGRTFWMGEQLSGGEWQSMPSSLFYRDADLVVMDEPTSALDAFSEVNFTIHFVFGVRKK
jgi:ATP-binding cassette subfamily B protein